MTSKLRCLTGLALLRSWYVSQKAQRAQKFFRLTAKNLGLTDYTDYTDYACLAASGISLLIPQKAKVKYRKKQK